MTDRNRYLLAELLAEYCRTHLVPAGIRAKDKCIEDVMVELALSIGIDVRNPIS